MTEQQTKTNNWLEEESKIIKPGVEYEKLEPLKLEVGKITTFTVDFSNPFKKWTEEKNGKTLTKAIIPVTHKGTKKNLWLNVKNPLYHQIIQSGKNNITEFKISTTGTQGDTRYNIVEED